MDPVEKACSMCLALLVLRAKKPKFVPSADFSLKRQSVCPCRHGGPMSDTKRAKSGW